MSTIPTSDDTPLTPGTLIDQKRPISLAIVVAVVCGVLILLLLGWTIFEALSRIKANIQTRAKLDELKTPGLSTIDSIVLSAKENATSLPEIIERPATSVTSPSLSTIQRPSSSPSRIVSYYLRMDNAVTPRITEKDSPPFPDDISTVPRLLLPTLLASPVSISSYYEKNAPMHTPVQTPDMHASTIEGKMAMESAFRALEERQGKRKRGMSNARKWNRI